MARRIRRAVKHLAEGEMLAVDSLLEGVELRAAEKHQEADSLPAVVVLRAAEKHQEADSLPAVVVVLLMVDSLSNPNLSLSLSLNLKRHLRWPVHLIKVKLDPLNSQRPLKKLLKLELVKNSPLNSLRLLKTHLKRVVLRKELPKMQVKVEPHNRVEAKMRVKAEPNNRVVAKMRVKVEPHNRVEALIRVKVELPKRTQQAVVSPQLRKALRISQMIKILMMAPLLVSLLSPSVRTANLRRCTSSALELEAKGPK